MNYIEADREDCEWEGINTGVWVDGENIRSTKDDLLKPFGSLEAFLKEIQRRTKLSVSYTAEDFIIPLGTKTLLPGFKVLTILKYLFENPERKFYLTEIPASEKDPQVKWVLTDATSAYYQLEDMLVAHNDGDKERRYRYNTLHSTRVNQQVSPIQLLICVDESEVSLRTFHGVNIVKGYVAHGDMMCNSRCIKTKRLDEMDYLRGYDLNLVYFHELSYSVILNSQVGIVSSDTGMSIVNSFVEDTKVTEHYINLSHCEFRRCSVRFNYLNMKFPFKPVSMSGVVAQDTHISTGIHWWLNQDKIKFNNTVIGIDENTYLLKGMTIGTPRIGTDLEKDKDALIAVYCDRLFETGVTTYGEYSLSFIRTRIGIGEYDGLVALTCSIQKENDWREPVALHFHENHSLEHITGEFINALIQGGSSAWVGMNRNKPSNSLILKSIARQYAETIYGRLRLLREIQDFRFLA